MMIPAFKMINWPTWWRDYHYRGNHDQNYHAWSYHLAMLIIKPGVDDHFNDNAGWVGLQRGCWSGLQGCAEGFWGSALSLKSVSLASSLLSSSSNFMWSSSSSCWSSKANGARWMLAIVERWSWSWPTSWIGDYQLSWSWSIKVSCDHKYWMTSSINDNPWWTQPIPRDKEELATIESIDSGAVYTLALKTHIGMSIATWRYFAGWWGSSS